MDLVWLGAAMAAFLGTHFVLSHPLRAPLVRALGARGFQAVYSLIALATFGWTVIAFARTPAGTPLWDGTALVPWIVASLLTLVALALFMASLVGNPALPGARVHGLSAVLPRGVFRITRHPMMMGFALWSVSHILIAPTPRGFVLMGGLLLLALGGSHLQDEKKKALYGTEWRSWMKRTSFWPNLANIGELRIFLLGAILPWLFVTWLHIPLALVPAGPWRFISGML
ncbi:NnrU family protein [Novosphingobium sp. KCTC 2891]|uniref:NnrU family protein n=1 Tax=Novosphingobium sp. KCTC 2891 TaxID=2989730 RepID=UPI0022220093|nr:NnrU family protein [Novosphingobium sp. KCTC 2891]MCW1382193.1 NnrU family protein [Novosphingobium sp. KCTC 2891]